MPEYLFARTRGIIGLLERLIEDDCVQAIDTGAEQLTTTLLDAIDINLGNVPDRAHAAGEIPEIPPRPPTTATKPVGRNRNTVFDDHGTPAGAAASA